ncbi:MAG TPA: hypothetical protein VFX59_20230 [Polyangiales bacterium]|nr:hypothetical protein [Polyangiales bacterium]
MPRALIAALLALAGCSDLQFADLGSEVVRDAGREGGRPLGPIECETLRQKLADIGMRFEAGVPPVCQIDPLNRACALYQNYEAIAACLSALTDLSRGP